MGVTPLSSPAAGRAGAGVPEGWPPGEKLELTEDMRKVSKLKKWASLIINAQKTNKKLDKEVRLLLGPAKNNIQWHNKH